MITTVCTVATDLRKYGQKYTICINTMIPYSVLLGLWIDKWCIKNYKMTPIYSYRVDPMKWCIAKTNNWNFINNYSIFWYIRWNKNSVNLLSIVNNLFEYINDKGIRKKKVIYFMKTHNTIYVSVSMTIQYCWSCLNW